MKKNQMDNIFFKILFLLLLLILTSSLGCGGDDSKPPIPSNLRAIKGNFQTTLTWDNVPGVSGYNLYFSINEKVTRANAIMIPNVSNPYIHQGLSTKVYYYIVTSVKDGWVSFASNQVFVDFRNEIYPPEKMKATPEIEQVTVSWESVNGATSYNIYWSKIKGAAKTNGIRVSGTTNPYIHTGLTNGDTYYYVMTASNDYYESDKSEEISATPGVWIGEDIILRYDGKCTIMNISTHLPPEVTLGERDAIESGEIGFCLVGDFSAWQEGTTRFPVTYENNSLLMDLSDIPFLNGVPNRFNVILYDQDTFELLTGHYLWCKYFSPDDKEVLIRVTSQESASGKDDICMAVVPENGIFRPVRNDELVISR